MVDGERTVLYGLVGFMTAMYLMSNYSWLRPKTYIMSASNKQNNLQIKDR